MSSSSTSQVATSDLHREADLGKAYDARLMRRLWVYIRPHRGVFWAAMLCLPLTSACSLAQPYLLKVAIDQYIAQGDRVGLFRVGALYAIAMLAEFGFLYLQYYLMMVVAQKSLARLRLELVEHIQHLPARFFDRNPVGRLVTRLTTDVDVINEMFAAGCMPSCAIDSSPLSGGCTVATAESGTSSPVAGERRRKYARLAALPRCAVLSSRMILY